MNEALRARIVTALLLAALVVVVLLKMPPEVAVVLISVAIFIAGYEWAGFAQLATRSSRLSYAAAILLALTGAETLADDARWLELILRAAALWWLLAFVWLAIRAKAGGRLAAAGAGFIVLVPAGIGLSHLVTLQPDGRLLLLYLLVLIAAADVGAYFGGRRFGRRKLAPHVSPGKTWEGFAAGMLAAAAVAIAGATLFGKPLWPWLFLCELVALVSVVGDLTESMFKRHVGLKDSGRLLPGHGGILDRIDSLTAAAPTFLLGLFVLGLYPVKRVAVLGCTGSIGVNTLDVLGQHPDRYVVTALAAATSHAALLEQCLRFRPAVAVLQDAHAAAELAANLRRAGCGTEVLCGLDALNAVAAGPDVDVVMAAIVGAAGLPSTLAAARAGKHVLVANKESLVMAGALLVDAARRGGASLVPIDSEHNAIFQCMPHWLQTGEAPRGVRRILLTASGGPFLRASLEQMAAVTPDQACAHPRWRMGRKISVDSATLMNKGLELIEACVLFGMEPARVAVVVHPQSIVHSMVEYVDGSILAQLGNPDMRTPIAHALGWPERIGSGVESLDLVAAAKLEFEAPDLVRFPSLVMARAAAEAGGTAPAALNAANEVAVAAFLEGRLDFLGIPALIDSVMSRHGSAPAREIGDILEADRWARGLAQARLGQAAQAGP